MTVRTRYWLYQVVGWGSYSALGLAIAAANVGWSAALASGFALYAIYSIALTEGFRQIITRARWLDPPVRLVWLRMVAISLAISAIQYTLVIAIDGVLSPGNTHWSPTARLWMAWSINLKWIESSELAPSGGLIVTLRGGAQVEMSRRQSDRLRPILQL